MFRVAIVGAMIAGAYGILHDQITYSISSEFFTKLKFDQFHYADFGWGDRFFASTIGFLATWWVGLIAGWLIARRVIPSQPADVAIRQVKHSFLCMFAFTLAFGAAGYALGLWRGPEADYSAWAWAFHELEITGEWAFLRVAYIHNAGYLGGLVGLVVALLIFRPARVDC